MTNASARLMAIVALALAGASLALQLASGGAASRASAAEADSSAAAAVNDLGPADALLLNDAKPAKGAEGKPVTVKAEAGHLAWADQPTARAWSIAAINSDKALQAILSGTTYADKRKELEDEAKRQEGEFQKRYEELQKKYAGLEPNSPDAPRAQQELNALGEEYGRWRDGSMRIVDKLAAEQIENAYRELVSAIDIVSDREHIDIVLRFMPTADAFNTNTMMAARQQVIDRTFLRYPEAIDITAEVMKELGVKE